MQGYMNLKKCTVRYMYIRALYGGSLDRDRIPGLGRYPGRLRKSIVDSKAMKNNSFKTICRFFGSILGKCYFVLESRYTGIQVHL